MKRLSKQIKQDLAQLSEVKLGEQAKRQMYNNLISDLSLEETTTSKANVVQYVSTYFDKTLSTLLVKPVGVFVIVLGVIILPSFATLRASFSSYPGDALYPINQGITEMRLSLAWSDKKKAKIKLERVRHLANGIPKIAIEQQPGPEREQKLVLTLEALKNDTDSVKETLKKVKDVEKEDEEVIKVAKEIHEETLQVQEALQESIDSLATLSEDPQRDSDITKAIGSVQEVVIESLDVIAEKSEDVAAETEDEPSISEEDLGQLVQSQLETITNRIDNLNARINEEIAYLNVPTKEVKEDGEETIAEDGQQQEKEVDINEEAIEESDKEEPTEEQKEEEQEDSSEEDPILTDDETLAEAKLNLTNLQEEDINQVQELIDLLDFSTALKKLSLLKDSVDGIDEHVRSVELKNAYSRSLDEIDQISEEQDTKEQPEENQEEGKNTSNSEEETESDENTDEKQLEESEEEPSSQEVEGPAESEEEQKQKEETSKDE